MNICTKLICLLLFLGAGPLLFSQSQSPEDAAYRFIEQQKDAWELNSQDISDLELNSYHFGKKEKIHHFYFIQRHQGVKVHNAVTSVHLDEQGNAFNVDHRFVSDLASKVNVNTPAINQEAAVLACLNHLQIPSGNFDFTPLKRNGHKVQFDKGKISRADINVDLVYQNVNDEYRLAWDVNLDPVEGEDYWSMRMDALTGELLNKQSWTVHCNFHHKVNGDHDHSTCIHEHYVTPNKSKVKTKQNESAAAASGTYNVFGEVINGTLVAYESPIHGDRNLLVTPHLEEANPFGWHDTNGEPGPEYTITRGNNVYAYLDLIDNNTPEYSPDGGANLNFDFAWDANNEPEVQQDAAVTNLFFMVNYIHDFSYAYGFDAEAGNFQANNYGVAPGGGGDFVLAEAQDGGDIRDADHLNNANFATPADGGNGRMQMYLWERTGGRLLNVLAPEAVAGLYQTATAGFGPQLENNPIIDAEVALAFDASQAPTECCFSIENPEDVAGKVAMVDRGGCFFESKVVNAEAAGAIACIICNFEDAVEGLGATPDVDDPGIPSVMVSKSDCDLLKIYVEKGLRITLAVPDASGPNFFDGDFDNGVVAHEFGHGISNRLTGGRLQAGCLGNSEQMGEGWSDFFTLVTTTTRDNTAEQKRGIGTWVSRETTDGNGIRPAPYTTDMSINDLTYGSEEITSIPHSLGSVWCTMLWDLYWAMVDEYGFDDDIINGTGGNNMATQLVMTGMKLQPCSPGFVDGRDAIFLADQMLFDGVNECLIWKVFARRGLGYNADQASNDSAADGIEDFNPLPTCIKELKLTKNINDTDNYADVVLAGESVNIVIDVVNHKDDAVTEVVVNDEIPAGATAVNISDGGTFANGMVTWNLGTVETLQEFSLTYDFVTDGDAKSKSFWLDDVEAGNQFWAPVSQNSPAGNLEPNKFQVTSAISYSGNNSWGIINIALESIENLILLEEYTVIGTKPVLRFQHNFNTEAGLDAGYLQISTDATETWTNINPEIFKNQYPRPIDYGTFVIPFLSGFSGDSDGWVDTWIDLTDYLGETVNLRFRFATDDNGVGDVGWFIDDIEYLDMVNYNANACINSAEGDNTCDDLANEGIKIEPELVNAVDDVDNPSLDFKAYPNPASQMVNLFVNNYNAKNTSLSIVNTSGQVVKELNLTLNQGIQTVPVDVSFLSNGFYFIRLNTDRGVAVEKVMIHNN